MPIDPTQSIAEILGQKSEMGFDPASKKYACPYIDGICKKRSAEDKDNPYPVCTIVRDKKPICICPKRFAEVDFIADVVKHVWRPANPDEIRVAREVQMKGFGNVDFVLSEIGEDDDIRNFISVELQSIDITGTVRDAYDAIINGEALDRKKSYGLNWKNVYKRYIYQLVSKGYYHAHWGSKIVAILQDEVYDYICNDADFMRKPDIHSDTVNIIFMSYKYNRNSDGALSLGLDKIEGTHHTNLQNAVLYKSPPTREDFCAKITAALNRKN